MTTYGIELKTKMLTTDTCAQQNLMSVDRVLVQAGANGECAVAVTWKQWAGSPSVVADGLTRKQAEYVADALKATLTGRARFNLKETLRRYDAGF